MKKVKKQAKKLKLKKSVIKNLNALKQFKGGRDPNSVSGHAICVTQCPCTVGTTCQ